MTRLPSPYIALAQAALGSICVGIMTALLFFNGWWGVMVSDKFTPETLRVEGSIYEHMAAEIVGKKGIAQVWNGPHAMAYARLFAAAPELFRDLAYWLDFAKARMGEMDGEELGRFEQSRAALAKATP